MRSLGALGLTLLVVVLVLGVAEGARAEEPKPAAAKGKTAAEVEQQVWKTVMGSAPIIDACTESYTNEYPESKGAAKIDTTVQKDGSVGKVKVSTSLEGARNLVPCLEKAAKTWRFPKLNEKTESVNLSLSVQVHKGVKFNMKKPGEKEQPQSEQKTSSEEEGFIYFLPGGWVESPP